jgi:predicted amidohydrolase
MTQRDSLMGIFVFAVATVAGLTGAAADSPNQKQGKAPAKHQEAARVGPKADRPPRKVIVGTAIFGPYGNYGGLDERLRVLTGLIEEMGSQADRLDPHRGLDLAILPETIVTSTRGPAQERAIPLKGKVEQCFSSLARKQKTYILVPFDLAETGPEGPFYSNAAVLFDRQGKVAGIYRKAHPVALVNSDVLEGGITPGRDFPVFECDFGKLGVQICWDIQFDDGWAALAKAGADIVAWPTASPATASAAARAAQHRYYVVSSTWRDNATIYEPTGLVSARVLPPGKVLVHEIDLSYAILGWSSFLENGEALKRKYGDRVSFHYETREDVGLFWSNDPRTSIGDMVRSIGGEEIDAQVDRNRRLHERASGGRKPSGAHVNRR